MEIPSIWTLSKGVGADFNGRDNPESYIERPGQHSGVFIFATWKPIGHNVSSYWDPTRDTSY